MDYQEIFDTMLAELVEKALHDMVRNPKVREADAGVTKADDAIHEIASANPKLHDAASRYTAAVNLLLAAQYQYLYIQGAKDMVRMLREFSVIK